MPNRVRVLTVPDADRTELERRARAKGAPARVVERARIVLLAADGLTGPQIAERAGCTEPTVVKLRRQGARACPNGRLMTTAATAPPPCLPPWKPPPASSPMPATPVTGTASSCAS